MANLDVTQDSNLQNVAVPLGNDRLLIVDSATGTLKDVSISALLGSWVSVSDTWTYTSATTVAVPSDATTKYKKGWGIRLKQGGAISIFILWE